MIPTNKGKILWEGNLGTSGQSVTLADDYTKYEKIIILPYGIEMGKI